MSSSLAYGSARPSGPAGIIASAPRPGASTPRGGAGLGNPSVGYYNSASGMGVVDKAGAPSNRYSSLLSYNRNANAPSKPGPGVGQGYASHTENTPRASHASRLGGSGRSTSIPASNRTARHTKTPSNYWDKQQGGSSTPRLSTAGSLWGSSNIYTGPTTGYASNNTTNAPSSQNPPVPSLAPNPTYHQRASTPGARGRLSYYTNNSVAPNAYYSSTSAGVNNTVATNPQAQAQAQRTTVNPPKPMRVSKVTLILDLDETLVHSSFDPIPADLHIPLVMDGEHYVAYVNKRPHVERFLSRCVELFDVVVWTASLAVYAEPLINELCRMSRCGNLKKMYREHCSEVAGGGYVKDLTTLGRSLDDVVILDNSPSVAVYQPNNLLNIVSWYDDMSDTALLDLIPHLDHLASTQSVYHAVPHLNQVTCKQIGN